MAIAPARSLYIDPIRPGELVDINFAVCYYVIGLPFNGAVCEDLPSNQYFNATVSWEYFVGEDEDNIPYLVSGNIESDTLNNVMNGFKFKAPEYMNIGSLQVKVTVSTTYNGSTIIAEDYITIEPDTSVIVKYNPESIAPGDTTKLIIRKVLYGGSIVNYSPLQSFEVGMINGCALGKLNKDEVDTNYLYGVTQPVYFIADSSADSGVVKVKVGLIIKDWEVTGKIVNSKNQNIQSKVENSVNEYCFIGNFKSVIFGEGDVVVKKKYELEILEPTSTSEEWITNEPKMPEVICKARLKNYDKGDVTFEWEYFVRYRIYRHYFETDDTLCSRTGMVKFIDTTYANNSNITTWSNNFLKSKLDSVEFIGKYYTCDDTIHSWAEGEEVFTGGWVYVQATAKNSAGVILGFKQIDGGVILGHNPTKEEIINYAEPKEFKAIIVHEGSYGDDKLMQFNIQDQDLYYRTFKHILFGWKYNKRGYPTYGVPNGFGLSKIDNNPYPSEMDLWNWKSNVNSGKIRFDTAVSEAVSYLNKFKIDYTNEIKLMNAYQHYNGNRFYHTWDKDKQKWVPKSYLIDKNGKIIQKENYGGKVINVYNTLP